ncbi:MAG: VWA domain-containing protein [Thermoanaerobaculia bacterium]
MKRGVAAAILGCLAMFPALAVQEEAAPPLETFFGRVDVDVVEVTVWVTDKDGQPVRGLQRQDFEVLEDGKPVEISNFLEVRGGEAAEEVIAAEPAEERETETATPPAAPPARTAERPLYLAVYIDNFNIAPANRRWAMQAIERFLVTRLRPDDRVMLATYDRDLHVRQPFTTDRFAVTDAIGETLRVVAEQSSRDRERRQVLEDIFTAGTPGGALFAADSHARYVELEVRRAMDVLRDVVQSLAGLEGRKALLYVADGLPDVPAEDLFMAVDQRFQDQSALLRARRYDLHSRYQELFRRANASGVTLYTLDAKGQPVDASASAEYSGVLQHVPGANVNVIEITRQQNLAAPMLALAAETGGRAILRTNALDDALAGVGRDFTDYYSLGYRRAPSGEQRYHTIKVRLKRKGLQVRHREGYLEKDADTRLREGTEAALQHGMEANPLGIEIRFHEPQGGEGGQLDLPVEIRIPLDRVALIPRADAYQGRLEVAVAILDTDGRSTPVLVQPPLDLVVPAADWPEAQSKYYTYALSLRVHEGRQRVTVAVRDALANQTSYLNEPVTLRPRETPSAS